MSAPLALLGFVVGMFVGLSGVGAGVLMAPALILLGVHPSVAIGTDLAYSEVTKLVGALRYAAQRLVSRRWLVWSSVGSVPATAVGAMVTRWLLTGPGAEGFLRCAVAVVLILASVAIVAKEVWAGRHGGREGGGARELAPVDLVVVRPWAVAALGAGIGLLVGLTAIGSGSLFMMFLLAYSRLSTREAVATDIANAAVLTAPAALLHLWGGSVDLPLATNLLIGSIPGILLGTRFAQHVPVRPLKYGVVVLVILSGVKMLLP